MYQIKTVIIPSTSFEKKTIISNQHGLDEKYSKFLKVSEKSIKLLFLTTDNSFCDGKRHDAKSTNQRIP